MQVLRYYFAFLLAVGIGASMLSNSDAVRSPVAQREERAAPVISAEPNPVSEADMQQAQGKGLVLRRQIDGHFYADAQINGTTVRMLVDTGASGIALSRDDARKAGIGIPIGMHDIVGQGAGGPVKGEYVILERIALGNESAQAVPAVVLDGGGQSLLGQSFLQQFASVEIRGETMMLQ